MKIGFKRGDKWHSSFIRAWLNSQWSHSAVAINGRLYESVATKNEHGNSGVRDYELTDKIASQYEWFDIGGDDNAALARYQSIRGFKYDYLSLISFVPLLNSRDSKRCYCNECTLFLIGYSVKWRVTPEIILTHVLRK
jgi:hypothetical protein